MTDQIRARYSQRVQELSASTIRAISGDKSLHFRAHRLHGRAGALALFAPHLHPSVDRDDFRTFRGAADGLALRITQSDAVIFERFAPKDSIERLIFSLLEQYRVEAILPPELTGMRGNLLHAFEQWARAFHGAGLTETANGLLLFTVAHMCRSRVTGDPIDEDTSDRIETTRGAVGQLIGDALYRLKHDRFNQTVYALHALRIASAIALMMTSAQSSSEKQQKGNSIELAAFALMDQAPTDQPFASAITGNSKVMQEALGQYRVFTKDFDIQVAAQTLVRAEQLRQFRDVLDERIAALGVNAQRFARQLRQMFAVPLSDGWDGGQEEGLIDGKRISQLVSNPAERRLFKSVHISLKPHSRVTLLIDCSGSMKMHMSVLAPLIEIFARALEMAGVQCEILGFSTAAWNGGRAQKTWAKMGKPLHPGRLNEACHLVFKSFTTPLRQARPAIASLLKSEIFREGIDGEAVLWAAQRLMAEDDDVQERYLMVLSDGSPMDSATNLSNDAQYLDHHLRDVVHSIEVSRDLQIMGVGVGLDMSPYYRNSVVLDLENNTANQSLNEWLVCLSKARST
jgi:cobaltochelatase CobT